MRVSLKEARRLGWVEPDEVTKPHRMCNPNQPTRNSLSAVPVEGADPQSTLWRALLARDPQAMARGDLCWEARGLIPGRRFRVDIAWVPTAIAIEVDGYQFHGRMLSGFHRDREKDRLLRLNGWTVMRFAARDISKDMAGVIDQIEALDALIRRERG